MTQINDNLLTVNIAKRENQAGNIAVIDFNNADGSALPEFTAGAHIDVYINDEFTRQYSLCNDPEDNSVYRIAVLNDPDSRGGSEALFEQFAEGQTVHISTPRNLFPLVPAANSILIGGGIGITPLVTMAHALQKKGQPFELHYCLRKQSDGALVDYLKQHFAEQLQFHCTQEGEAKRIDLASVLSPVDENTHIYSCGSKGLLDSVINQAKELGYADSQVHYELFNADVDISGDEFEVVCELSEKTISVGADESIATALKREGIKVAVSCEEGVCGTCICEVLQGKPDHRDEFLTDEEKADNDQIALCCSRSKSKQLVIEI